MEQCSSTMTHDPTSQPWIEELNNTRVYLPRFLVLDTLSDLPALLNYAIQSNHLLFFTC